MNAETLGAHSTQTSNPGGLVPQSDIHPTNRNFGSRARIRTWIGGFKVLSPTIERPGIEGGYTPFN